MGHAYPRLCLLSGSRSIGELCGGAHAGMCLQELGLPPTLLCMRVGILLFLMACGASPEDTASACPPVTDPCMNEENYQECLEVEASCEGSLAVLESCPLQFGCGE